MTPTTPTARRIIDAGVFALEKAMARGADAPDYLSGNDLTRIADLTTLGVWPHDLNTYHDEIVRAFNQKHAGKASVVVNRADNGDWLFRLADTELRAPVVFRYESELADALRRAADAHHEYERDRGVKDADWPTWYARYIAQTA